MVLPLVQELWFLFLRNTGTLERLWITLLQERSQELHSKHFTLAQIMSFISSTLEYSTLSILHSSMELVYHFCSQLLVWVFSVNGWMKDSMLLTLTSFLQLLMISSHQMQSTCSNGHLYCYVSMDTGCLVINRFSTTGGLGLKELMTKCYLVTSFSPKKWIGLLHLCLLQWFLYLCKLCRDSFRHNCLSGVSVWLENRCQLMRIFQTSLKSLNWTKELKWLQCTTTWKITSDSSTLIQTLSKQSKMLLIHRLLL